MISLTEDTYIRLNNHKYSKLYIIVHEKYKININDNIVLVLILS